MENHAGRKFYAARGFINYAIGVAATGYRAAIELTMPPAPNLAFPVHHKPHFAEHQGPMPLATETGSVSSAPHTQHSRVSFP